MEKIIQYYQTWGLVTNPEKTDATLFTTRNTGRPTIKINNHNIEYKDKLKYLGVTLDRKLSYNSHITHIRN